MMFSGIFERNKRHPSQMFHPGHSSIANYCTEALHKSEMKHNFSDDLFLNNLHLIPDPLKKNLADTLITNVNPQQATKKSHLDCQVPQYVQNFDTSESPPKPQETTMGGISSFFSGVMSMVSSVMFRSRSPVNYYDCFDESCHQGSPRGWQGAKNEDQDKNGKANDRIDALRNPNVSSDMNIDSRTAVSSCESKLHQVRSLLSQKPASSPVWCRKRPKKVFVEPGSVCESYDDAFSPEDLGSLPDDSYIEYYSPVHNQCEELYETAAEKTKVDMAPIHENSDIVKHVTMKNDLNLVKGSLENNNMKSEKGNLNLVTETLQMDKGTLETEHLLEKDTTLEDNDLKETDIKHELVSSCEDKLSKLKALLRENRKKCTESETDTTPVAETRRSMRNHNNTADKHYKNPNRRSDKRQNCKLKCRIEDDLLFANEIHVPPPQSADADNSPSQHCVKFGDYFDEVCGRFRTASTGSDDSFQIVFNDCPRRLIPSSDCESEDSFIVFEEPESCYMSNDVFGNSESDDSDSDVSDSGCAMLSKLSASLTRTVGNLADDSLYESEDEVDFSPGVAETINLNVSDQKPGLDVDRKVGLADQKSGTPESELPEQHSGLIPEEKNKLLKKDRPVKKVRFSTDPPKVHVMCVWAFAAKQARIGHWETCVRDRDRFKRRITDVDMAISWVLKPQHRSRVMFQRFMPWWNAQKRQELAEKKQKEEEDKRKAEEQEKVRIDAEGAMNNDNKLAEKFAEEGYRKNAEESPKEMERMSMEAGNAIDDRNDPNGNKEVSRSDLIEGKKELTSLEIITDINGDKLNHNITEIGDQKELSTEKSYKEDNRIEKEQYNNDKIVNVEKNCNIPSNLLKTNLEIGQDQTRMNKEVTKKIQEDQLNETSELQRVVS